MQRKICTRIMDELGRVILPLEARTALEIKEKQALDVYIDEDVIFLKPNHDIPVCTICGESDGQFIEINHNLICKECIANIQKKS